jgi:hypothetical protein
MLHRPGVRDSSPWPTHGSVVRDIPMGSTPSPWLAISSPPRDIVNGVSEHFGYAIDKRYLPVLLPFLLRPARDGVTLNDEGSFVATFGLFKIVTPRANIPGAHITRHYRWWTACGVRGSRVDDGLTFGTNHDGGVCIHFTDKVPSPLRRTGHSALTVTVADLDGLMTALGGG